MLLLHMKARDPRGVALRNHDDGLLDIGVGAGLLSAGILTFLGLPSLAGIYAAIWFPLSLAAKAVITLPRAGVVEGPPLPLARYVPAVLILPAFLPLVMTLPAHVAATRPATAFEIYLWIGPLLPPLLPGLLGAAALWLAGRRLGGWRLSAYAGLVLVAWLGGTATNVAEARLYLATGAAITASGATILRRFLRSHPPAPRVPAAA